MSRRGRAGWVILAVAVVLAALAVVAWRQSATRETMQALDRADRELAVARDELEVVTRDLVAVESRRWIAAEALRRLGLRPPTQREVILAAGGTP